MQRQTAMRAATPADLPALIDLSRRTIRTCYGTFLGEAAVDTYIDSGAVDRYVSDTISRCTVITLGDEVVGFSVSDKNLIDLMMIDHELHGRGLGAQLLRHVEADLFDTFDQLTLQSFAANQQANGFYIENGWRPIRRFADAESGVDKIVFGKAR